jgi:hypothetical protein
MLLTESRCFIHHERRLFDPDVLAATRARFVAEEVQRQARVADAIDAQRVEMGAATLDFRLDPHWYDPWRAATPERIERLRPFTWLLFPAQLRHITVASHLVPWHQDAGYARLMPRRHGRLITCFVPLEVNPTAHASLEFAEGEYEEWPHQPHGLHGAAFEPPAFERLRRFSLSFGDGLVFGDLAPHRTVAAADGTIDRRSFEYRLIRPADALPDKDYFNLETGLFVRTDGSHREFPQ